MALCVLPITANILSQLGEEELAADMKQFAENLIEPVRRTFSRSWFARAWLYNSLDEAYLQGNDLESDKSNQHFLSLQSQPWFVLFFRSFF
jgi:hypothetical protein